MPTILLSHAEGSIKVHLTLVMASTTLCGLSRTPNIDLVQGDPRNSTCRECLRKYATL